MTPHPQADILRAIADGEDIEAFRREEWFGITRMTALRYIYDGIVPLRIKPKVISINGIEVPEPMREEPENGTQVWVTDPMCSAGATAINWYSGSTHENYLKSGFCHLTKEAAAIHSNALISFTRRI